MDPNAEMKGDGVGVVCRSDEPGAWYAMLPLEMVYAFDPIPPEPDEAVPMSRDSTSQDSAGDSKLVSNGGSTAAPHLPPDWVLDRKDASNILGGQVRTCLIPSLQTHYIPSPFSHPHLGRPGVRALPAASSVSIAR